MNFQSIPGLEHLLGVSVHLNDVLLESRNIRNIVVTSLPLLLLQLDGDATNSGALEPLHEMGDEASDLVAEGFGGDESDLLDDPLVGVEVQGELGVVLLDQDPGGLLHGLGSDASHRGFLGFSSFKVLYSSSVAW